MPRTSFLEPIRSASVLAVAAALGLKVRRGGPSSGGAFGPCLACGAERRHTKTGDRRLACGVRSDGLGYRCFQCDVSGDAAALVAWSVGGAPLRDLPRHRVAEVRAWCERYAGSVPAYVLDAHRTFEKPSPPLLGDAEVADFWRTCVPVTADPEVATFLGVARGIDPAKVAAADSARALPESASVPRWASCRGAWSNTGRRLIVPMFDPLGRMRSFRARLLRAPAGEEPKSAGPKGYSCRGCVFASPPALAILRGEPVSCSVVVITEGEPDTLAASVAAFGGGEFVAVVGIVQGSFTPEIAARIPRAARVVIATHHDEQGDKYAAAVRAALPSSQRVDRLCPLTQEAA